MTKKIFIFRGPPASGKGTITDGFIKKIPSRVARIELDKFRWGIHLNERKIADVTDDEHRLAYKNYLDVLENYLQDGSYTIVTEGLFSWDTDGPHGCMQDILKLCDEYNYKVYPVLLSADYETLWKRNQNRDYSVPKDEFKELYEYVMNKKSENEIAINVGNNSVSESVEKLSQYI